MLKIIAFATGTSLMIGLSPMIVDSSMPHQADVADIGPIPTDTDCSDPHALKNSIHFQTCRLVAAR